mmetsp:Transcript_6088/g.14170  ORF Transcript_6088/g.14170 Transcript_6088/m.14170 type:complete len:215 (+) Transcript_6088:937-1581(+)
MGSSLLPTRTMDTSRLAHLTLAPACARQCTSRSPTSPRAARTRRPRRSAARSALACAAPAGSTPRSARMALWTFRRGLASSSRRRRSSPSSTRASRSSWRRRRRAPSELASWRGPGCTPFVPICSGLASEVCREMRSSRSGRPAPATRRWSWPFDWRFERAELNQRRVSDTPGTCAHAKGLVDKQVSSLTAAWVRSPFSATTCLSYHVATLVCT